MSSLRKHLELGFLPLSGDTKSHEGLRPSILVSIVLMMTEGGPLCGLIREKTTFGYKS